MQELINKLVDDLRWRLGPHGAGFRPTRTEVKEWQAPGNAGRWVTVAWLAALLLMMLGGCDYTMRAPWVGVPLQLVGALLLSAAGQNLEELLEKREKLKAYRRRLERNERFVLTEYAKYLKRQLKRAAKNPALGGEVERARLQEALDRLNALLAEGAGREDWACIPSHLASEADAAEALVQAYEELGQRAQDPAGLAALDERLPGELRARLEAVEHGDAAAPEQPEKQPSLNS